MGETGKATAIFPEERNIVCCDRTLNDRGVCICQSSGTAYLGSVHFRLCSFYLKRKTTPKQILYYHYAHAAAKIFYELQSNDNLTLKCTQKIR